MARVRQRFAVSNDSVRLKNGAIAMAAAAATRVAGDSKDRARLIAIECYLNSRGAKSFRARRHVSHS